MKKSRIPRHRSDTDAVDKESAKTATTITGIATKRPNSSICEKWAMASLTVKKSSAVSCQPLAPMGEMSKQKKSKNATEYTFTMKETSTTNSQGYKGSMQERFKQFRAKKLAESRMRKYISRKGKRSSKVKDALRIKFVKQVESYIGVPYAQKYHEPGTADYDAPLFLDCCALVRRAVNDLQEDFGFRLGRWNQNYQFSTLSSGSPPGRLERTDQNNGDFLPDENGHVVPASEPSAKKLSDLKPGDLIFWEATYYSEKARKQRLSLVHVEVFTGKGELGEGPIGARWQKGHVQHFDTFRFESKSYHSIKYHFRSIEDTWLDGICKCAPAHKGFWVDSTRNMRVNKYSMFNADNKEDDEDYCDEGAGDVDDDGSVAERHKRRVFYVNKSNGWKLVASALSDRGWAQIPFDESFSTKFDLRWVERRSQIDWLAHSSGDEKAAPGLQKSQGTSSLLSKAAQGKMLPQLVNHIANNNVITVKTGLLDTLKSAPAEIQAAARFPETYDLSIASDRLKFLAATKPPHVLDDDDYMDSDEEEEMNKKQLLQGSMWILKPAAMNRGRGIRVINDVGPLRKQLVGDGLACLDGDESSAGIDFWRGSKMDVLAQRYLSKPLLAHGTRKFDVRAYCLVSKCDEGNLIAYFHEGYARVGLVDYDSSDAKLGNDLVHLTNIAVQRRHPEYEHLKDQAVLSMGDLQNALSTSGIEDGWILGGFTDQMKASMAATIAAAAPKLDRRSGCFDLLGFDFMASASPSGFTAHLIEVNTNPALHVSDGKFLQKLLPSLVRGAVDIVLEEHGVEPPSPDFAEDVSSFVRIFEEKNNFRFVGADEWVRRFSDASDVPANNGEGIQCD